MARVRPALLVGPVVLVSILVGSFALSAIANRLEFLLVGLPVTFLLALLIRRGSSVTGPLIVATLALLATAVLATRHDEQLRLGLAYYGASERLASPSLWVSATLSTALALVVHRLLPRRED